MGEQHVSARADEARTDLEERIRTHFDQGDLDGACTIAIEGYGPELLSYLIAIMNDEGNAAEAFSDTCETIWRELAGFQWRSSFRTWAYVLTRHAASRSWRSPHRRPGRLIPLSMASQLSQLAEQIRTQTRTWQRTEVKDEIARLRQRLTADEQSLLILRVDRRMGWDDVGRVLEPESARNDGEVPAATVAKLRKRFQRLKTKLRTLAEAENLLS